MAVARIAPTYTTTVTVTGGREGHASSDDGVLDVRLTRPGSSAEPKGTNPEQLFAAAYAACFQGALIASAKKAGEDASESTVQAEVSLGKEDSGAFGLAVTMTVRIPGMPLSMVQEVAEAAHEMCPYSRATRGNIEVQIVAAE